jgi:hypothetical protein
MQTASRPRRRTLKHMEALMTTAAALAAACSSKSEKKIDRSWPGHDDHRSSREESASASSGGEVVDPWNRYGSSSSGYAVVDPVPEPSRCSKIGSAVSGMATAKLRPDDNWDVEVELDTSRASEPLVLGDGTANSVVVNPTRLDRARKVFVTTVDPRKVDELNMTVNLSCGTDKGSIELRIVWKSGGVKLAEPWVVAIYPGYRW